MEQPVEETEGVGLIYRVEPSPLVRQVHGTTLRETDTHYIVGIDLGAYRVEWWIAYRPSVFGIGGRWSIGEYITIRPRSWWGDDEIQQFMIEGRE